MKISIVGLGYIGLPTAIVMAKAGHDVFGYDVNEDVSRTLNSGLIHIKEDNLLEAYGEVFRNKKFRAYTDLQEADVYIIAVPTPYISNENGEKHANLEYVYDAAKEIAKVLKKDDLVILESTSPPLTTKQVTEFIERHSAISKDDFYIAYCPERVLPGRILYELEHNDRIIGAGREESALRAKKVYESFVKGGKIYITDDITAEMVKLVENSFRDVNIAFANELSVICDKLKIDVSELIALANKHPRVNILNPGIGVGEHCISVDPWFIVELFDEAQLIRQARITNDIKPYWVSSKIEEKIQYDKSKIVGILGLAYKPNIDDLRESPSIVLAVDLISKGYNVIACEPNTDKKVIKDIPILPLNEVMDNSDVIVLAQRHDEFSSLEQNKKVIQF